MSSLMFLIYLSATGVAIALGRQAKRQRAEVALRCARLGLTCLPGQPAVRMLEALLALSTGLMLIAACAPGLSILLSVPSPGGKPGPEMTNLTILFFAAGLALIVLGGSTVRQILEHRGKQAGEADAGRRPVQ